MLGRDSSTAGHMANGRVAFTPRVQGQVATARVTGEAAAGRMGPMTSRAGAVATLLLAVTMTACGASQPSSAVEDDTSVPTSAAATASPEPSASAETPSAEVTKPPATPVAVKGPPPKPGNPTFKLVKETPRAGGGATQEYKITWTEPKGVADAFLVYGLPDCLRYEKKFDGKPCVVRGMKIPADKLVQLGVAPGDERSMTVSWDIGEIGPGPYSTILIRATNAKGDSIFTIVKSYDVCYACVY